MLIDVPIPGDRNVIKKEAENIIKYEDITEIQRMCSEKSQSDSVNKRGDWNHFRITQTLSEQHTGKTRN